VAIARGLASPRPHHHYRCGATFIGGLALLL
jgi:hypothetical protein